MFTQGENAFEKAFYIYNKYKIDCFADDTGLEIETINGEPGVFSSRYAGEDATFDQNMDKVLTKMSSLKNRNAQFKTVIALVENGDKKEFEGIVKGTIIKEKKGGRGFGYDPIFLPAGYKKTFAEMTLEEKNTISHRAIAVRKLIDYIINK